MVLRSNWLQIFDDWLPKSKLRLSSVHNKLCQLFSSIGRLLIIFFYLKSQMSKVSVIATAIFALSRSTIAFLIFYTSKLSIHTLSGTSSKTSSCSTGSMSSITSITTWASVSSGEAKASMCTSVFSCCYSSFYYAEVCFISSVICTSSAARSSPTWCGASTVFWASSGLITGSSPASTWSSWQGWDAADDLAGGRKIRRLLSKAGL